jgi:hypothetical protein
MNERNRKWLAEVKKKNVEKDYCKAYITYSFR